MKRLGTFQRGKLNKGCVFVTNPLFGSLYSCVLSKKPPLVFPWWNSRIISDLLLLLTLIHELLFAETKLLKLCLNLPLKLSVNVFMLDMHIYPFMYIPTGLLYFIPTQLAKQRGQGFVSGMTRKGDREQSAGHVPLRMSMQDTGAPRTPGGDAGL